MSDHLYDVPSAAIAVVTAAAVGIATPISEFGAVTLAKVAATGKAPKPKTESDSLLSGL
jgi:hypothetical protein